MGIKNIVVDDLTGQELPADSKPVDVRVDGDDYSVYLSDESKETFIAMLQGEAPLLEVQRAVRSSTRRRPATKSNAADVRAWGKQNGFKVPDRGRIPADVQAAYDAKDK